MNEIEQKIDLLLARQITKTRFATITVPVNDKGIPLGQGKCKAVVLHLNYFLLNDNEFTQNDGGTAGGIYYGDSNQQTCELLFNTTPATTLGINTRSSNIIFCNDLSEVWVRGKTTDAGTTPFQLEVIIYE